MSLPKEKRTTLQQKAAANLTKIAHDPNGSVLGRKAYRTPCSCGSSMLAVPLPTCHCPACHHSWIAKRPTAPKYCPCCDYNLQNWRLRKGIQPLDAGEGNPAEPEMLRFERASA